MIQYIYTEFVCIVENFIEPEIKLMYMQAVIAYNQSTPLSRNYVILTPI